MSQFLFLLFAALFAVYMPISEQAVCAAGCVLHPELTQGPYWVDLELVRQNVTEGKPGVPLTLKIKVVDTNTCLSIPNAGVEIWHCDSLGIYSHYEQASNNVQNPQTDNTTYLRGMQMTDGNGTATLQTIYPGWYSGRTIHIHLKVHIGGSVNDTHLTGGNIVHTGQLFANDSMNMDISQLSPYSAHSSVALMTLAEDNIFLGGGSYGTLDIRFTNPALGYAGGLEASVTVSVDVNGTGAGDTSGGSPGGISGPTGNMSAPTEGNPPNGTAPPLASSTPTNYSSSVSTSAPTTASTSLPTESTSLPTTESTSLPTTESTSLPTTESTSLPSSSTNGASSTESSSSFFILILILMALLCIPK